ncbi:MAG: YjgP/YjgQ family permease [Sphingobacteriaceae bacterium]|nr:MAG: YjgP/YjgQ family permease [Sphingobacteriaceae bacterium]
MKKIHLLLLRAFIRPFIVTFLIVMFVLLMLFLFKYIDDLVGKGFEWYIIMELMMYASATNVAMALPLSVLLSSIMTYGSLGENYELVAIKSAGISLRRAMYPMIIVVAMLALGAFIFSDYMLPIANLKYYSLLYDVRKQKSAKLLQEGVFSTNFPGYTIRVMKKEPDGQTLKDIMIYSKAPKTGNIGTNEDDFRSAFVMMNLKQLRNYQDSTKRVVDSSVNHNFATIIPYMRYFSVPKKSDSVKTYVKYNNKDVLQGMPLTQKVSAVAAAQSEIRSIQDMMKSRNDGYKETVKNIRRSLVEYEKKFTLSVACLVLFLIGAPLGAIIRKGGLGLPVVVSVIFFLLYHIISTIGEKGVKDGAWNPTIGMWIAIIVLTPIGMFLSYKAATDSALFDMESYKRFFNKLFKRKAAV